MIRYFSSSERSCEEYFASLYSTEHIILLSEIFSAPDCNNNIISSLMDGLAEAIAIDANDEFIHASRVGEYFEALRVHLLALAREVSPNRLREVEEFFSERFNTVVAPFLGQENTSRVTYRRLANSQRGYHGQGAPPFLRAQWKLANKKK